MAAISTTEETNASITAAMLNDQPATTDTLGFEPYVEATAYFLSQPATKPPLTMSVEGRWGSGKSSFLRQLSEALKKRGGVSIEFNPWRHERSESLWAAFALEFVRKVRAEMPIGRRIVGDLVLLGKRLKWKDAWPEIIRAALQYVVVVTLLLGLAVYAMGNGSFKSLMNLIGQKPDKLFVTVLEVIGSTGGALTVIVVITAMLLRVRAIAGNLFSLDLSKHMSQPDYGREIGFVERVHADFNTILAAYAGSRRAFVFIDDLDRADPAKAADLMQAINLLITEDSRVVFLIGMDREKVAAAIALKHERILPFLAFDYPVGGDPIRAAALRGLRFGFEYIEKFIQVPFAVPRPSYPNIRKFLGAQPREGEAASARDARLRAFEFQVSADSEAVHRLVEMVSEPFDFNPRRIKQFVNTFRLRAYLAHETGLFDPPTNLTLMQLGKIVAIELRWPLLIDDIDSEPDLLGSLEFNGSAVNQTAYWLSDDRLMKLIRYEALGEGVPLGDASLSGISFDVVMTVSPRMRSAQLDRQVADAGAIPSSRRESSSADASPSKRAVSSRSSREDAPAYENSSEEMQDSPE